MYSHISDQDHTCPLPETVFHELISLYLSTQHRRRVELIERVYRFAEHAHRGQRLPGGAPYILHPLAVARIMVQELGLGSTSICAALLHDVVEHTDCTIEEIEDNFGERIASIVGGITKISGGIFGEKSKLEAENFRRLLLSMSTDIRVVIVKMAERLDNLRCRQSDPARMRRAAFETLYLYAPIAHRLGLNKMKTELEDLAFRHTHPEEYDAIMRKIAVGKERRDAIVTEFITPMRRRLDAEGFRYEIKARVKSAWSIWRKMQKKGIPFEEVYDIYAIRVIFENDDPALEAAMCQRIRQIFSDGHVTHPDRLRDWTLHPKSNGYQALHITVMGPEQRWIEVQIRSRKMDDIAELGCAAHWRYKDGSEGGTQRLDYNMNVIKDILADPLPESLDHLGSIKLDMLSDEIYVFTKKGELITLPAGSTVTDMARATGLTGDQQLVAGKIAHKLVHPDCELHSGDQVELITVNKSE